MSETAVLRRPAFRPDWLQALRSGLEQRQPQVLVTVAQVKGSAPRDAGARMWVNASGAHDTIGGGHLEQQAIEQAVRILQQGQPRREMARFPLGPRLGQCCGGVVWLSFEYLDHRDLGWCDALASALESGCSAWRELVVPIEGALGAQDGPVRIVIPHGDEPLAASAGALDRHDSAVTVSPRSTAPAAAWEEATGMLIDAISRPQLDVVVCGAGHVGRAIVHLLGDLPVRVVWLDPREDWWPQTIPDNVVCLQGDADDVPDCPDDAYWLILTHSHALDLEIIEQVFRHKSFRFLGLIGSASKKARFLSQLRQRFDAGLVAQVQCPIGLVATSSKLPSVIAVSVVAQLLPLLEE
ncbi:xanthine dehydrogenase accessory protein XdhC [Eoetvoesiella caeni]